MERNEQGFQQAARPGRVVHATTQLLARICDPCLPQARLIPAPAAAGTRYKLAPVGEGKPMHHYGHISCTMRCWSFGTIFTADRGSAHSLVQWPQQEEGTTGRSLAATGGKGTSYKLAPAGGNAGKVGEGRFSIIR